MLTIHKSDDLARPEQMPRWRRALQAAFHAALSAWRGEVPLKLETESEIMSVHLPAKFAGAIVLSQIIAKLDVPLVLLDEETRIIAASMGALKLVPMLAAGKPIGIAMRNPDMLAALARVPQTGQGEDIVLTEPAPLERSIRISITPLATKIPAAGNFADANFVAGMQETGSPHIVLTLHDLSEIRTVERMRVDFVANASHELRTPLATLLGFIETLQGPAKADEDARTRFLSIMNDQARRMSRLIDDLLSLSRIEQHAHHAPQQPVDLVGIVSEIIDSLSVVSAERGVIVQGPDTKRPVTSGSQITGAARAAPIIISGDRDELLRLVENLVENAIKYGQDGKKVDVSVVVEDDQAVLLVRDYGPGISPEHIPRLTERFYRIDVGVSREVGGTGLGLAIVKHITLRHRGRLTIESKLGQGTCFRVALPLHRP